MSTFDDIKTTKYFKALTEAEQKTLADSFSKWPEAQKKEFIEGVMQSERPEEMDEQQTQEYMLEKTQELEGLMSELKESAVIASHDQEHEEKEGEMEEAEAALSQL